MPMSHDDILIKAGFSPKEASVYLANYTLGESTVARISQKSGVKRPTTYIELENLVRRGLVSQSRKKNVRYYTAQSPKLILTLLEESKSELESNMKNLIALGAAVDKKPSVTYFEGKEGLKEVYRDTLSIPNEEIQSWFSGSTSVGKDSFQEKFYIPERLKKNIWIRAILPDSAELKPYADRNSQQLRISKAVSEENYNMDNEIILYGKNKTAILNASDEIAIIIDSLKIHDSFKQIFETMWEIIPGRSQQP